MYCKIMFFHIFINQRNSIRPEYTTQQRLTKQPLCSITCTTQTILIKKDKQIIRKAIGIDIGKQISTGLTTI